jgi:hypothetical protein
VVRSRRPFSSTGKRKSRLTIAGDENGGRLRLFFLVFRNRRPESQTDWGAEKVPSTVKTYRCVLSRNNRTVWTHEGRYCSSREKGDLEPGVLARSEKGVVASCIFAYRRGRRSPVRFYSPEVGCRARQETKGTRRSSAVEK